MGLLDAIQDEGFRTDVARGLLDVGNRGAVAGLLGAPVDLMTTAMRPFGYSHPQPMLGSEWIGQKLQDGGFVSAERNPVGEGLAGLLTPGGGMDGPALMGMMGAISREGKARLLADLVAGKSSGTYRLGDVTEGQRKGLDELLGRPTPTRDVYMTDDAFNHILQRRIQSNPGFSPEEVVRFVEQAMAPRARPDLNVAKGDQHPSLLNSGLRDVATGKPYDSRMPLKQDMDGYVPRSVVPYGLKGRNNKAPER